MCERVRTIANKQVPVLQPLSRMVAPDSRKAPEMRREIIWVEKEDFQGWACSQCAWKFKPSGVPTGNTIGEMKQNYERQRDGEFASHLCREHPSAKN
jgi:hypothetical protein